MTAFCINPGRCAFCTASRMGVETQINAKGDNAMTFYLHDENEYAGYLILTTEDYDTDISVDVYDCYDDDTEEWNQEAVKATVEKAVRDQFGDDSVIVWSFI